MWTRSKLGIVNLAHATQVYPWEPKPGVYEVRAVFPGGDTLTLSEHVSREAAAARVSEMLARLGGEELAPARPWLRACSGIHSPYSGKCEHCQPPSVEDLAEMDAPEDKEPSFETSITYEDRHGNLHIGDAAYEAWREAHAK